ncbi:cobalamin B12-binding domain-containing protein [Streptomyces sp. NBC_00829]|uniref:cobalamin B12-binding domain-containing protein n=1 Tax=Streptomyces sp. NBC_00829 TaxID=2903679 RepID=UPI002F907BA2|nr:cobalamin B12-binding domain-containing protein [Streptomyces sp. NBC_00829]
MEIVPRLEGRSRRRTVVTGTSSDAHTWNLVFLQLLLEGAGHTVSNLGACVPDALLVSECRARRPEFIVISTVNGHGYHDGQRVVKRLRMVPELARVPIVIGGKLGIDGPDPRWHHVLRAAGFDAVFEGGEEDPGALLAMVEALPVVVEA